MKKVISVLLIFSVLVNIILQQPIYAAADIIKPELISITADKKEAKAGDTIIYTATVKDDGGMDSVILNLKKPQTGNTIIKTMNRVSDTKFQFAYQVTSADEEGNLKVDLIGLYDKSNNYKLFYNLDNKYADNRMDFNEANVIISGTKADITKPELISITADKKEAKPGDTIVYTATVKDDGGMDSVILNLKKPQTGNTIIKTMNRVSDTKFQFAYQVTSADEEGNLKVDLIGLYDKSNNSKIFYNLDNKYADNRMDFKDANVLIESNVKENVKSEAPTIEKVTTESPTTETPKYNDIEKPVVKYTGQSAMQIGSFHSHAFGVDVTDKGDSGIASIIGYLTSGETTDVKTVVFSLVSGSKYEGKISYSSSYDYNLEYVIAKDNAGNTTKYYVNSVSVPPVTFPTTEKPTTEKPTTEKPTTEKPTTEKPSVQVPTTEVPTTEVVSTEKPTIEKPQSIVVSKPVISNKYIGDNTSIITGKAKSYSTVYALVNKKVIGSAKVKNGKFTMKIAKQKDGTKISFYTYYKKKKSSTVTYTILDKTAPTYPTVNKVTYKSKVVTGKGEKSSKVYVYNGKKKLGYSVVDSKGNYKVKISAQKQKTILTVYLVDKAGNKGKTKSIKVS